MSTSGGISPATVPPALKQIRFVNNEGQPPAKRRRINAACRTCRKRKTRCDGKRPLCSTCLENGHECLGYADGAETNTPNRKDRRGSGRNWDNDVEDEEEYKNVGGGAYSNNGQRSPQLQRIDPRLRANIEGNGNTPSNGRDIGHVKRESSGNFTSYRDSAVYDDDGPSPLEQPSLSQVENHRVPYFRYFGPTAIVPGFKQMVVSVRENRRSTGANSAVPMSPGSGGSLRGGTPSHASDSRASVDMPIYDQEDPLPVNRLIIHLVETFFDHVGSNYPFLRRNSFIQRVEERLVEPILVDAVCALAARFSDHPLLIGSHDSSYPKSDYGHVFARRAKAAVVDTFPCPTIAAVQACLLLAYEGFGSNQDSALWMYLGCAIRMAVDLGLQKLDGVRHQGQKDPEVHRLSTDSGTSDPISAHDKIRVEQERVDTLWAVFMLDRVISSGTGRPVTLRDEDFELNFPEVVGNAESGWPNPFPALIQIIHLYGRVSDLLNNIRDVKDVTPKKIEGLAGMERDLTQFYQKLDTRLTFNAANFQHYVKAGEGTNFILVHFWFHTLIMLLHQPTLIHSFEGQIQQLLPNSRELSMSSAKTIADILAFAELIDPRSFIGNPFTSQPMYVAASAFLMESAAQTSQPTSRDTSPPRSASKGEQTKDSKYGGKTKDLQKHSLLAAAANQNYQRCYKALQQLEIYWAGARYILVALDQKAKGIWDPETYTEQEYESTKTKQDMIPNWRRKLSLAAPSPGRLGLSPRPETTPESPLNDSSQAIGWSLTGTTNSPSSNLTFMYQNMINEQVQQPQSAPLQPAPGNMIYDPIRSSLPESSAGSTSTANYPPSSRFQYNAQPRPNISHSMAPPAPKYPHISSESASTTDAEMLLGLQNSPFAQTPGSHNSFDNPQNMSSPNNARSDGGAVYSYSNASMFPGANSYSGLGGVGDMMMESQDIDMSTMGGDMMPWLEYLPQDILNFFDGGNNNAALSGDGSMNMGNIASGDG
ncbi:Nitrogen assimilation transcription factor nit-4 [Lachnellula suecica]|uniref:Nitrogen assimilation transcription factor nit-4 n=1 Tax=Lachnellula suecica TaxID=602035 RepID=A0A8T9CQW7_9HELO|nr:Nitrogen assimilation transcription factor nit-4 [Lachnellula suecica]